VAQVLAKKTDMVHTFTSHSELAVSRQWVLETLTTKLSVEHLQVLHLPPLQLQQRHLLHLLAEQGLILAKSFSKALQQVQTLLIYKAN
jgi:hypothetical protein